MLLFLFQCHAATHWIAEEIEKIEVKEVFFLFFGCRIESHRIWIIHLQVKLKGRNTQKIQHKKPLSNTSIALSLFSPFSYFFLPYSEAPQGTQNNTVLAENVLNWDQVGSRMSCCCGLIVIHCISYCLSLCIISLVSLWWHMNILPLHLFLHRG